MSSPVIRKYTWNLDDLEAQDIEVLRGYASEVSQVNLPLDEFQARRILISTIINIFNQRESWYRSLLPVTRNLEFVTLAGKSDRELVDNLRQLSQVPALYSTTNRNTAILIILYLKSPREDLLFWLIYNAPDPVKDFIVNNPKNQLVSDVPAVKVALKALLLSSKERFNSLFGSLIQSQLATFYNFDDIKNYLVIPALEAGDVKIMHNLFQVFFQAFSGSPNLASGIVIFTINNLAHSTSLEVYDYFIKNYFNEQHLKRSEQIGLMSFYALEMARYEDTQFIIDRFHDNDLLIAFVLKYHQQYPDIYNTLVVNSIFYDEDEDRGKFNILRDSNVELYEKPISEKFRPELLGAV